MLENKTLLILPLKKGVRGIIKNFIFKTTQRKYIEYYKHKNKTYMKKILALTILTLALNCNAQKGKTFPDVNGVTLDDKEKTIPFKNEKYSILAVAFHRGAEDELKKWLNPLYETFSKKEKKPAGTMDVSISYDVNFLFVPMIAGIKMIAEEFKSSTDKAFWPYVLDTRKSDMKAVATAIGVTDKKIPYIFVLDKNGVVVDVQSGAYNQAKVDAMEDTIE